VPDNFPSTLLAFSVSVETWHNGMFKKDYGLNNACCSSIEVLKNKLLHLYDIEWMTKCGKVANLIFFIKIKIFKNSGNFKNVKLKFKIY
jgi:hypothetical protein